jgi:hypothetical protein
MYVRWLEIIWLYKVELPLEGIFFALDFLPWEFLLVKKLEIQKTKTSFIISVLKVVYLVVLVFSISNFFANKNSQGRKLSSKKYLLAVIQHYSWVNSIVNTIDI